jgi:AraC-like DNA-binding protein
MTSCIGPSEGRSPGEVLYDLRVVDAPREWVRAWKPAVPGIHEVFQARFAEHAYPPHTHASWTVFVVDEGAVRYDLESHHRGAAGPRVTILPPHVVHDGRAASVDGYRKRVLYVDADVLAERLVGRAIDHPDIEDPSIVREFGALHSVLRDPERTFEAESHLALMCERVQRHLGDGPVATNIRRMDRIASDLRDLLDAEGVDAPTLAEAGRMLHVSPAHLVRCFARAFGIAPHRYLIGRRIDAARERLLHGESIAQVAAEVGFHDQAHLTRHFRRHVGVTPGRYVSSASP